MPYVTDCRVSTEILHKTLTAHYLIPAQERMPWIENIPSYSYRLPGSRVKRLAEMFVYRRGSVGVWWYAEHAFYRLC
jgi:hypothetical protein